MTHGSQPRSYRSIVTPIATKLWTAGRADRESLSSASARRRLGAAPPLAGRRLFGLCSWRCARCCRSGLAGRRLSVAGGRRGHGRGARGLLVGLVADRELALAEHHLHAARLDVERDLERARADHGAIADATGDLDRLGLDLTGELARGVEVFHLDDTGDDAARRDVDDRAGNIAFDLAHHDDRAAR